MIDFLDFLLTLKDYGISAKVYFSANHEWFSTTVFWAFTFVNSLRILAYVPQMLTAAKDVNGASGISYTTWTLFLISHLTTIAYAIVCLGDLVMALIFLGNALACLAVIAITFIKRRRYVARPVERRYLTDDGTQQAEGYVSRRESKI